MRSVATIGLFTGVIFAALHGYAQGDGLPGVEYLTFLNDVVVVGTATVESRDDQSATIGIHVARTIKGKNIPSDLHIPLTIPSFPGCSLEKNAPQVTAIWFLRVLSNGELAFGITPKSQSCHPMWSEYVVPEGPIDSEWAYSDSLEPKDKLAYELAAAAWAENGTGPGVFSVNILALSGATEHTSKAIGKKLATSPNVDIAMLGRANLIMVGDPGELENLAENVSALSKIPIKSSFDAGLDLSTYTYKGLVAAVLSKVHDSSSHTVNELGTILKATDTPEGVRFAAARSLRNIHTPLAVTYLAPLLWQHDVSLRDEAIGGLASFANAFPAINYDRPSSNGIDLNQGAPYKTDETLAHYTLGDEAISKNEDYFLSFWRQWWTENGNAVSAAARSAP